MSNLLLGARILVVDDEVDVCDMVADLLPEARVDAARTYDGARALFAANRYDVAILDIMGVRGYDLLREFGDATPCIMLTAHALGPRDLERSAGGGAALYLPKDEIASLPEFIEKVRKTALLSAAPRGPKHPLWAWLFRRIDFPRLFGADWRPPE
jgi:DNA-binding response OmpR family regulator